MKQMHESVKNMTNVMKPTHLWRMPDLHAFVFVYLDGSVRPLVFQTRPCIPCIGTQTVAWCGVMRSTDWTGGKMDCHTFASAPDCTANGYFWVWLYRKRLFDVLVHVNKRLFCSELGLLRTTWVCFVPLSMVAHFFCICFIFYSKFVLFSCLLVY
jgi:hypothetical protein